MENMYYLEVALPEAESLSKVKFSKFVLVNEIEYYTLNNAHGKLLDLENAARRVKSNILKCDGNYRPSLNTYLKKFTFDGDYIDLETGEVSKWKTCLPSIRKKHYSRSILKKKPPTSHRNARHRTQMVSRLNTETIGRSCIDRLVSLNKRTLSRSLSQRKSYITSLQRRSTRC